MASEITAIPLECPKCGKTFASKHGLSYHQNKARHVPCDLCDELFHTIGGASAHRVQVHRARDGIKCPGCSEYFPTAGTWMQHVEKNRCSSLYPSDVTGDAAKVLSQFREELGRKNLNELLKKLDDQFAAMTAANGTWANGNTWDGEGEADTPQSNTQEQVEDVPEPSNKDFWHCSLTGDDTNPLTGRVAITPPEERPQEPVQTLSSLVENSMPEPSDGCIIDPDSPKFSAERFYNRILEVYKCPHMKCKTECKDPFALMRHLKSPKHTAVEFGCPECGSPFTTGSSWVQHAETVALYRCTIRNKEGFGRVLGEVSNGSVTVKSVDSGFKEKVKFKLTDDWVPQSQAPGANPGRKRDPSTIQNHWSGLVSK